MAWWRLGTFTWRDYSAKVKRSHQQRTHKSTVQIQIWGFQPIKISSYNPYRGCTSVAEQVYLYKCSCTVHHCTMHSALYTAGKYGHKVWICCCQRWGLVLLGVEFGAARGWFCYCRGLSLLLLEFCCWYFYYNDFFCIALASFARKKYNIAKEATTFDCTGSSKLKPGSQQQLTQPLAQENSISSSTTLNPREQ